ncbi:archease [Thermogladius sp.]|uniref:archease n=1 Tax=Thermogladius sp. TaxID=2023064 RepID=UPI003D0D686A
MVEEKIVYEDPEGRFYYLEHTSDIYVKAVGSDILELLENAGLALFESMVDTKSVRPVLERGVSAEGFDLENLLYRWLEALLTVYYSERIMCRDLEVHKLEIERRGNELNYRVSGRCVGEVFDPSLHEGRVEVKAVTYSLMRILKDDKWTAYFVLDI